MTVALSRTAAQRDVTVCCSHGTTHLSDDLPSVWTDADHVAQAVVYHQVDFPECQCSFGQDMDAGDDDDDVEVERVQTHRMVPPVAVQLAAQRLRTLELAGLLDDDDLEQEQDRKLLWFFRKQRDQAD